MTIDKLKLNKKKTAMKNIVNTNDTNTNQNTTMNTNMQIQLCTITTVNGFQYLTSPETKLMDYIVEEKNIAAAASAVRDEAFDSLLPVSETLVCVSSVS